MQKVCMTSTDVLWRSYRTLARRVLLFPPTAVRWCVIPFLLPTSCDLTPWHYRTPGVTLSWKRHELLWWVPLGGDKYQTPGLYRGYGRETGAYSEIKRYTHSMLKYTGEIAILRPNVQAKESLYLGCVFAPQPRRHCANVLWTGNSMFWIPNVPDADGLYIYIKFLKRLE